jgi:tetratricopeptide (TPR) repeat protein
VNVTVMSRAGIVACVLSLAFVAVGCGGSSPAPAQTPSTVTFNKDIAPIVFDHCATCHRPGEVAPFSLLSYADAVKHADGMAAETIGRHMPPWLPEPGDVAFVGDRRLHADQIDLIQRWAKGGKLEGNPADLPKTPVFPNGWQLGTPDVILTAARPFKLNPSTDDVYRNLVLRTSLKEGVFVRAVEFKTNGAPVHHAVIRVDTTLVSRRRDGEDGQPGFDGMAWQGVQDPGGQFIGWAPGRGPILSPEGMPWRLDRGADLVVELHVIPSKKPLVIQPTIGLFLTNTPPVQTPVSIKMSSRTIDIPPGARDYVVTDTFELPVPVDLLSVYPHAHYLGKDMLATATLPDGTVKTLIHIRQWSFHWQQDYRYVTPIPLPRGTTVAMRYTYDNSDGNNENPRHPPVRVRLGPRSVDEMGELGLQVITESPGDSKALLQSFDEHVLLANVASAEMKARNVPDSAENQAFLGAAYVEAGRFADAIPPLEAALRLNEASATAHSDLGTALLAQGRPADALVHLQRAVALAPKDETMQFNLGNALSHASRFTEAAAAYERALALNPEFVDAHVNLGTLLLARGAIKEALAHAERAVDLMPDSVVTQTNLSSTLASAGRFAEAMQHVRRALELQPNYPPALDNLKKLQQLGIR